VILSVLIGLGVLLWIAWMFLHWKKKKVSE
jgi:hypothetical protein